MQSRSTLGALLLILGLGVWATAKPVPPPSSSELEKKKIAELIVQLGSDKYQERVVALQKLEDIGEPALPLLKKAHAASNSEAAQRAGYLVRKIEERLLTAHVPNPMNAKRVHYKVARLPVMDAVSDLSRLSGFPIRVQGDLAKLKDRKITLDTGDVTFWEAFDKLCEQSGLTEPLLGRQIQPLPAPPPIVTPAVPPAVPPLLPSNQPPNEIVVMPGSSRNQQFSYAGSVRVRIFPRAAAKSGQYELTLDASAEPRLQGFTIVRPPAIAKAIDDQGQNLAPSVQIEPPHSLGFQLKTLGLAGDGIGAREPRILRQQVNLRFKAGEKPAKTLKAFAAKIYVQVKTAPEAILTVKDVLKSAGASAKAPNGGTVKLEQISKRGDGDYLVKISLSSGPGPRINFTGTMEVRVFKDDNGIAIGRLESPGLPELFDAAGNKYHAVQIPFRRMSARDGTGTQEASIVYRADTGYGDPQRLVVTSSRLVMDSFPIEFRDVPLE